MQASGVVAHGLSCSVAYGIFPDQGSNPCPLHWEVDSLPLDHQGSLELDSGVKGWGNTSKQYGMRQESARICNQGSPVGESLCW